MVSCDVLTVFEQQITCRSPRHLRERWKGLEHVSMKDDLHYVEEVVGDFLTRFPLMTPTVMLRRDVFARVGLFDENLLFGQTLEFFARVLARYPLAFVAKPLVYQRIHDRNHTRDFAGYWTSYLSIVDRMLKNPGIYPRGAGEAHRAALKETFHQSERDVARLRSHQ
jgi:hypothetical protein